ncbi:MAG: HAD hydrolase-like protein [Alphaproteobacteria bacterium]
MENKNIRNIIIDTDGVIFTLDIANALKKSFPDLDTQGINIIAESILEDDTHIAYSKGELSLEEASERISENLNIKHENLNCTKDSIIQLIEKTNVQVTEGIWELLEKLKAKGVNLYLLPKTGLDLVKRYKKEFPEINEIFGDNIISTAQLKQIDNKEMYIEFFKFTNLDPKESLIVEDEKELIKYAKSTNASAIEFTNIKNLEEKLQEMQLIDGPYVSQYKERESVSQYR